MLGGTRAVVFLIAGMLVGVAQPRLVTDLIAASTVALGTRHIGKEITRSTPGLRELGRNLADYSIVGGMRQINETLANSLKDIADFASLARGMNNLSLELRFVEVAFSDAIELIEAGARGDGEADVSRDFVDKMLSDNDGLLAKLRNIQDLLFQEKNGIFPILKKQIQAQKIDCTSSLSHQQHLYQMLTHLLVMELKSYVTMQYCIEKKGNIAGLNFTIEGNDVDTNSTERIYNTITTFRDAMKYASRRIWRCDPQEHRENKTYTELKSVFSRIILHEKDLNKESFACHANCGVFKRNVTYKCNSHGDICARQRGCKKVEDCGTMDDTRVCLSNGVDSTKRYEFVEKHERSWRRFLRIILDIFRIDQRCPTQSMTTGAYVQGQWGEICVYCDCICTESSAESDRYFNLMPVESDVEQNFVVTGLRFRKKHHVVHIQIQQGKLAADGMANSSTVHWKNINAYAVIDNDGPNSENGVKYHKLEWFGKRKVVLDDIESPENHVVTGVRFITENDSSGVHLKLQIRSTPYDPATGELFKDYSVWHSGEDTDERTELQLNSHTHPIRSGDKAVISSKKGQYLQFQPTGIMTEDAGQSTIPFLDLQSVGSSSPTAITGVGLVHKAAGQSGGYLALKVHTFDAVSRLDVLIEEMKNLGLVNAPSSAEF